MRLFKPGSIIVLALSLVLLAGLAPAAWADQPRRATGSVYIQQVQVAMIGSGGGGSGRLSFRGKSYPIKVVGLGVGGIGLSKLTATGTVYDLNRLADFEGLYGQIRLGWALANKGGGYLWLKNGKGVVLKLKTRRQGLMLAGGADGVNIRFAR
ncbi:hypothetical protein ACMDCR_03085 [Labrys okinawensis]|uniref:hypothetical protein n=1 Tax=Labrys okinawensis TaxID=346911 RepID=UPI0039BC6285